MSSDKVSKNYESFKNDMHLIKNIVYDIPKAILKPVIDKTMRNFKQLPNGLEVIDAIMDDINPFDVIPALQKSVTQEFNSWKEMFKDLRSNIKSLKEKERNRNMKQKNKSVSSRTSNTTTHASTTARSSTHNKGLNHPEWYLRDPVLVKDLIGINISNRLNTPNDRINTASASITSGGISQNTDIGIPSIAAVQVELTSAKTLGQDWIQAINNVYKNVRAANAGAINYSPAQLSYYIWNLRLVDCALSTLHRAIACLNSSQFYDALAPAAYFAAMGLDFNSFIANAANARELYNRLATIRYRNFPLNISLFDRTRWMFSNVFKDSNDAKSQLYLFRASKLRYVSSQAEVGVITISDEDVDTTTTGLEYSKFTDNILEIFDLLQSDDIFQVIAGDILKAYKEKSLVHYPLSSAVEVLDPIYDEFILSQIQNASLSCQGSVTNNVRFDGQTEIVVSDVSESVSATVFEQTVAAPNSLEYFNKILNSPYYNANVNVVEPGKVLSTTRLMTSRTAKNAPGSGDSATIEYNTHGTEIVEYIEIVIVDEKSNDAYRFRKDRLALFTPMYRLNVSNQEYKVGTVPAWAWFDYFPMIIPTIVIYGANASNIVAYSYPMLDFNNFGIVYDENLSSYHAICIQSLLFTEAVMRANRVEVIGY